MATQALVTGDLVELLHEPSRLSVRALVESKSEGGGVSLCSLERPYEKLRVAQNAHVDWAVAAAAKFSVFIVERDPEARDSVFLRALAHQKRDSRDGGVGWYLGVSSSSEAAALIGDAGKGDSSRFRLRVLSSRTVFQLDAAQMSAAAPQTMALSRSQRQAFMRNGFLLLRDAVPMRLVNAARRRVNHELGVPGRMIDGGVEGAAKLAGNTSNSEEVRRLFHHSDVAKYVDALLGAGNVEPPSGAQIALRFPELGDPRDPLGSEWHTDGMRQGKLHPFTLLVGVALSDATEPLAGNLTVFPESHRTLQRLLTADGKLRGYSDECFKADSVWGEGTLPDMGTPVQLLMGKGDVVLAHPNLAHRGGLNFSPDIRYQIYFRIKHKQFDARLSDSTNDLWADLDGLHDLRDAGNF
jgi:hypothetical protein